MCVYFVCTVFTTIGFGDISAVNYTERVSASYASRLSIARASFFSTALLIPPPHCQLHRGC
jgi:hypothetical protein